MEWKDKLYNYEVPPPENIWGKISQDLDNGDCVVFKERLFHHEEIPPADVWQKILARITDSKVIPITRKSNLAVKMLAAAAITALLFLSINYLLINQDDTPATAQKPQPAVKETSPEKITAATESEKDAPEQIQYTLAAAERSRKLSTAPARAGVYEYESFEQKPSRVALKQSFTDNLDLREDLVKKLRNSKGEIREDVTLLDLPNSYFTILGPNGQTLNVSSKFRNSIKYLNADKEELLDVILRESQHWKGVFSDWKTKVSSSSFAPTADNFMDIVELMSLIQETK